jgi:DNA-binding NarL/FixJ family response regulator
MWLPIPWARLKQIAPPRTTASLSPARELARADPVQRLVVGELVWLSRNQPAMSLTASELRAAELAAQGLTNRQIAETLFVTLKTVELHLGHSYGKLGIGSRSQLPEALAAS